MSGATVARMRLHSEPIGGLGTGYRLGVVVVVMMVG